MEGFCASKFWDPNATWYTDDPDFTPCFEQTVFVWVPCAFLWLFVIFDVYYIKVSKDYNIPWNKLNISKLVLTFGLMQLTFIDFVLALVKRSNDYTAYLIYPVDIWTPVIQFFTFFILLICTVFNRKYGIQTSGCQFIFWLLVTVLSIIRCRTEVRAKHYRSLAVKSDPNADYSWDEYKYISFMIYFAICCAMLLLNCFADAKPRRSAIHHPANEIPETSASFLSRITYRWFDIMVWKGYRQPLTEEDLWDLRPQDSCKQIMPTFTKYWNQNVRRHLNANAGEPRMIFNDNEVRFENPHDYNTGRSCTVSIMPPIYKSFCGVFLFGSMLKLITDILTFAQPQILGLIIGFVEAYADENRYQYPLWKGVLYAVTLFVFASLQTLILSQYFHRMFVVGLRIRSSLINAIYRKALVISNAARVESTVGEIVNLMSVDTQRFTDLTVYLNMLWSAPLQIALALYFLWQQLGVSVLAGFAVMVVLLPINARIANKMKVYQIRQMKLKDERVKMMNEILSGIKVLKLYAWEKSFQDLVLGLRKQEISALRSTAYLNASTSFLWSCAPFLVSLVTFTTYVLIDETHVLNPTKTFVSLSLFNILRFPLTMLPLLISNMVQTQVSVTRINKFLNSEELDPNNVQHDTEESNPLSISNGVFTWDGEKNTLQNINIQVKKKTLCAIVGKTGAGKSSLIHAFLGEMRKITGTVNTVGSIAYVPQQAWIQNATLRENILFGNSYDKNYYDSVIKACALEDDIAMLSARDETEIGEKGINLSGGQKQRVSLARAVYTNADLYLLDDPLSAVDANVGKHIFDKVIGPKGLLKDKTRILVTHGITFLPQTHNIYVMEDGEIRENGTYMDLLAKGEDFSEFIKGHNQRSTNDEIDNNLPSGSRPIRLATTESLSDIEEVSTLPTEEEKEGPRRRRVERQDSILSNISATSATQFGVQEQGQLIKSEESQTGKVNFAVYKHYIKSIGLSLALLTLLLNAAFQGFQIGSNIWLSEWSNDKNVTNNTGLRDKYLRVYAALGLGQALFSYGLTLAPWLGTLQAARILHQELLLNIFRLPQQFFDTIPLGRILSRFSKDIESLDSTLPDIIDGASWCFFEVLGTIVVIGISTPIFLLAIIPLAILYYFAQQFFVPTSRQLMRLESVSRSPIYSHFGETVSGVSSIRAYGAQNRFIEDSDIKVDKNQMCKYPSVIANRWLAVRLEMVANLIILFAALFAVIGGQTNPGLVGLSVSYALQVTQTLNWLVRMTSEIETNIVAVERIKEYSEKKKERAWTLEKEIAPKGWPHEGKIEFENFHVRYRKGLNCVLRGINLIIEGGKKVGIVGRTGAGKSSLTLSLFRILEADEGRILIDGVDIADLGLQKLRSSLTIIPQDPVLFSGTLKFNLDPFGEKKDEDIWKALELSNLKEFAEKKNNKLNHEMQEDGGNMSVGERQLVCLARALLRKTKILILDEATAAIDLDTDKIIQKTIRNEFEDCTVITIAHRLNTILDSDIVVVLENGEVKESDEPNVLLADPKSIFYSMAKDANLV